METLKLTEARNLAVNASLLKSNVLSLEEIIKHMSYIQIDTISAVERAHHITLWNRDSDYSKIDLNSLHAKEKRIFEYWSHAASYIPIEDYRFYLPLMKSYFDPMQKWVKDRYEKVKDIMPNVLKRIEQEGPLGSKDFKTSGKKNGQWWNWKPGKFALEMLFWQGKLMVKERKNFHRIYDLTERVLPDHIDTKVPSEEELGEFLVTRAIKALGIATERDIIEYFQVYSKDIKQKAIEKLEKNKTLLQVKIEGLDDIYYTTQKNLEKDQQNQKTGVFILSPFDNFIINRKRTLRLFNFDYALECYVPSAKRKFGYFVHPILCDGNFIGRLDPKADRKKKVLHIKNLLLEDPNLDEKVLPTLATAIREFAEFNECEKIEFEEIMPKKLKQTMNGLLR